MQYTLVSRNETGEIKQKWHVDTTLEKAEELSQFMFIDNTNRIEIFENRVPKGDFWGLPIKTIFKGEK